MRRWYASLAVLVGLFLCGAAGAAAPEVETAAAQSAARTWLAAADALDGARTWTLAAPVFQTHVTKEQWGSQLSAVREPLGALKTRAAAGSKPESAMPGAPDGQYLVLQFHSVFEHKANSVETLIMAKQPDGAWRLAGYYIR